MTVKPSYDELAQALRGLLDNSSSHERPGAREFRDRAAGVLSRVEGKTPVAAP